MDKVRKEQNGNEPLLPGQNATFHIGKMIEEELRSQERTITWFSRQLHCDRRNVYDIFNRTSIDTQLLLRVSCVLKRNFFRTLADMLDSSVSDGCVKKCTTDVCDFISQSSAVSGSYNY